MLDKRAGKTTLLWIPGHHGIAGNEEADVCAKQASAIIDGTPRPVSFAAATALSLQNKGGLHQDSVLLARLRTGHTPLLKAYANQLDTTVDPKCPSCGEEPQTVEH